MSKKNLLLFFICSLLVVSTYQIALAQNDSPPFLLLDQQLKKQQGGWAGDKENLSTIFNAERIRLGDKFDVELLKYIGRDAEKHYWIATFLVEPSYLHGNKPLPYFALAIQQQGLSLLQGKQDTRSLGRSVGLNVNSAVLSAELGLYSLAESYKQEAERLLSSNSDLRAWYPGMGEYESCLYEWIGKDHSKTPNGSPCKKDETPLDKQPLIVRITTIAMEEKVISKPAPIYPEEAKKAGISGEVLVEVTINTEGRVELARVVRGNPMLQEAAVEAARQARFPVTKLADEAVRVIGVLTYKFPPKN
jgi:TonB family protein